MTPGTFVQYITLIAGNIAKLTIKIIIIFSFNGYYAYSSIVENHAILHNI